MERREGRRERPHSASFIQHIPLQTPSRRRSSSADSHQVAQMPWLKESRRGEERDLVVGGGASSDAEHRREIVAPYFFLRHEGGGPKEAKEVRVPAGEGGLPRKRGAISWESPRCLPLSSFPSQTRSDVFARQHSQRKLRKLEKARLPRSSFLVSASISLSAYPADYGNNEVYSRILRQSISTQKLCA